MDRPESVTAETASEELRDFPTWAHEIVLTAAMRTARQNWLDADAAGRGAEALSHLKRFDEALDKLWDLLELGSRSIATNDRTEWRFGLLAHDLRARGAPDDVAVEIESDMLRRLRNWIRRRALEQDRTLRAAADRPANLAPLIISNLSNNARQWARAELGERKPPDPELAGADEPGDDHAPVLSLDNLSDQIDTGRARSIFSPGGNGEEAPQERITMLRQVARDVARDLGPATELLFCIRWRYELPALTCSEIVTRAIEEPLLKPTDYGRAAREIASRKQEGKLQRSPGIIEAALRITKVWLEKYPELGDKNWNGAAIDNRWHTLIEKTEERGRDMDWGSRL